MASIAALRCLCRSRETNILSTKSRDLSLDQREPNWLDASPWLFPMLTYPSGDLPWFLLQRLPRTSNSRSLTNLHRHSSSWSLLSQCSCARTSNADRYVCEDPSPKPECSSSRYTTGLHLSYVSFLTTLSPWRSPQIRYRHSLLNDGRTCSVRWTSLELQLSRISPQIAPIVRAQFLVIRPTSWLGSEFTCCSGFLNILRWEVPW